MDDYEYEVVYRPGRRDDNDNSSGDIVYTYTGSIRAPRGYPRIAAMSCFGKDSTYKKDKLVAAALLEKADLLVSDVITRNYVSMESDHSKRQTRSKSIPSDMHVLFPLCCVDRCCRETKPIFTPVFLWALRNLSIRSTS